jgi:outer membrane protein OmpA-like peptidoglycan-associated protein
MSRHSISWRRFAAIGVISVLSACAQSQPAPVASNPPPVPPGPNAVWYHIAFDSNSFAIDGEGQKSIAEMTRFMQRNPTMVATVIGRTDTVASREYNMHLSHQRADAVRDALVYNGKVTMDRVETRWTGETSLTVATANGVPAASNLVVDIAIH